jgi:hypothetical protein
MINPRYRAHLAGISIEEEGPLTISPLPEVVIYGLVHLISIPVEASENMIISDMKKGDDKMTNDEKRES